VAAAAAVLAVATVFHALNPLQRPNEGRPKTDSGLAALPVEAGRILADVPPADRFVVENLDLLQDFDVLTNFQTLQAMDQLARRDNDT
jgi:hypothetical protein